METRQGLTRYAWLSILTALLTIMLKILAYVLTGSIGLLSDAMESGVNLVAAIFALVVLTVAAQPPDAEHSYGHDKAEYFAGGAEGTLILVAALTIAVSAIRRLFDPAPLQQIGLGLGVSVIAAVLNLIVAQVLMRAGRQYRSVTLEADAHHLMTDVWTSGGVLVGLGAVAFTGWEVLDPLIALLVAGQIIRSGVRLVRTAILGLMDTALPSEELLEIEEILARHAQDGVQFHALRTRRSGARRFVSVHIQVPGVWSVQKGHALLEDLERDVRRALQPVSVFTHLEPLEDPRSWEDISLVRDEDERSQKPPP